MVPDRALADVRLKQGPDSSGTHDTTFFFAREGFLLTSPFRDEVQVPVDPKTMEPLPAHE